LNLRERFLRFPRKTVWFQPLAGGLMVGMMGWFVPQVLGVGYKHVSEALNGGMAVRLMVLLLILKLLAVTTSYASGNAGGIFGPSLFIGAMLGGIVGNVAHSLLPTYVATPGVYALQLPSASATSQRRSFSPQRLPSCPVPRYTSRAKTTPIDPRDAHAHSDS